MDRQLIEHKLESLRRCLARVVARCPDSAASLAGDQDAQDILSLNLTRAVQICVDIAAHLIAETEVAAPQTMGQTFELLAEKGHIAPALADRMKKAVGFRNVVVQNYEAVDWQIVYAIATRHLVDFSDFARAASRLTG